MVKNEEWLRFLETQRRPEESDELLAARGNFSLRSLQRWREGSHKVSRSYMHRVRFALQRSDEVDVSSRLPSPTPPITTQEPPYMHIHAIGYVAKLMSTMTDDQHDEIVAAVMAIRARRGLPRRGGHPPHS